MLPISSCSLFLPPKCYRRKFCDIFAVFVLGTLSAAINAQSSEYINKQGSKIIVAQASFEPTMPAVHEKTVLPDEQQNKPQRQPTSSKVMVVAQADNLMIPSPLVVENTSQIPEEQTVKTEPAQKSEKIPGLSAAKMPPPPQEADPQDPPIYVSGEFLDGYADTKVVVRGKGQLIRDNAVLQGEELTYNRSSEVAIAQDDVRLNRDGDIFLGQYAQMHIPTSRGYVNHVNYWLAETGAHGESEQVEFLSKEQITLFKANYTLCEPKKNGKYDWNLTAKHIDLDYEKDEGVAKNAVLKFMDVPILAAPRISFPLSDKRRSGLLIPTFRIDSDNGFTYLQPYYWNIAPNYDATITPIYMSKRGAGLQGEFRYLHWSNVGQFRAFYLPNDRNFDRRNYGWLKNASQNSNYTAAVKTWLENSKGSSDRWAYSWQHEQRLISNMPVLGHADVQFNLNRISDPKYVEHFPKMSNSLTSRLLNNEGTWKTSKNGFSTLFRVQRWQTLQNEDYYSAPPFDRTQLRLAYNKENVKGFDLHLISDYTRFKADRRSSYFKYLAENDPQTYLTEFSSSTGKSLIDRINNSEVDSKRGVLHLSASYPIRQPGWFVVPKLQIISRHYNFDSPVKNMRDQKAVEAISRYYPVSDAYKSANIRTTNSATMTLPTLSLDAGLIFERKASLFGKNYTQTLEPRMMYAYTPYRDQSMLPIYDSGAFDYNLASIYVENPYSGYDRIADAHMVIMGVGTRWQNSNTGAEVLGLNIAQRYRFKEQRVTLNDEPLSRNKGDWLFSASTELLKDWRFDALVQYNPDTRKTERNILRARWKPGPYRVLNFGYRMVRDTNLSDSGTDGAKQLDFSWQWPLGSPWAGKKLPEVSSTGGRWYSVGRINYSLEDKKLVDGVFGLEYQSCCWIARGLVEKRSTGRTKAVTGVVFQLELTGLSRIGMDPLKTLRESIDRYETISSERIIKQREFYLYE